MQRSIKIQCHGLDVWGNEADGFEINDVLGCHGSITVDADASDEAIIQALIDADIIYPGKYEIDEFGDEDFFGNLVDPENSRPILQLSQAAD